MISRLLLLCVLLPGSGAWAARIGYFGDSQSAGKGALFDNLNKFLSVNGNRVETARSVCGATIEDYSRGGVASNCSFPNQTHLTIDEGKGGFVRGGGTTVSLDGKMNAMDVAVIQLGDNHLEKPSAAAALAKSLAEKLLKAGKGCVWIGPQSIGPANSQINCIGNRIKKQQVSQAIRTALEKTVVDGKKCSFVDSFSLTDSKPSAGDKDMCLHYAPAGYKNWANAIQSRLESAVSEQVSVNEANRLFEAQGGAGATREGG